MLIGLMAAVIVYWIVVWALSRITRKLEDSIERMHEYNALMDELDEIDGEREKEDNV